MLFLLFNLPSAQAADPAARWGQQAVFVESTNQMYVVGGASSSDVTEVTNDVYILSLNDTATWSSGPNNGLPAHSFASMAYGKDTITVAGGMTASCSSDATVHTLDLTSGNWSSSSPSGFVRRHGAGAATADNGVVVIGGLVDKYVCASSSSGYAAMDLLSSGKSNSTALPLSLTGGKRALADFAMASSNGKVYLGGGQASDGVLVPFDTVATWNEADGWNPQVTKGDVPAGRLGASLVAHPTLDVLVLFGGATQVSSAHFAPSAMVSVLNTSTWEWSSPQSLQPSHDAAIAYHSAVMTPSGVMVTAFGRSASGSPSNAVNYLDMRDPTGSTWGWKSTWDQGFLDQYTPPASTQAESQKTSNKGTIAAAVVPTVIGVLIIVPLALWLWRRHMLSSRQRRLASHFSFATQEDRGDFNRPNGRYPFGFDGMSSAGSLNSLSKRVMTVFRRGTKGVGDDGTINEGEMVQVEPSQLMQKDSHWEEIDFGLGRIDAERREANYTDLPSRSRTPRRSEYPTTEQGLPFPMPVASTISYPSEPESPEVVTPTTRASPALGELVDLDSDSPRLGSPRSDGQLPLVNPNQHSTVAAAAVDTASAEANDWNMLEQSMMARPVFNTSPNSSVRSHAHPSVNSDQRPTPYPAVAGVPTPTARKTSTPSLPPLQFSNTPIGTLRNVSDTTSRHLAGSGRRGSVSASSSNHSHHGHGSMSQHPATMVGTVDVRRGPPNALGLSRVSHLRAANHSELGH